MSLAQYLSSLAGRLTASGKVPQAALDANVAGTGPAFSAYQSVAQNLTTAYGKISFQSEEFDTASAFDNVTNYRFTPLVAGYYQFNGAFQIATTSSIPAVYLSKNGAISKLGVYAPIAGSSALCTVSALIYMNGTTDYIELWGNSSVSSNLVANSQATYFQGYLARAA